MTVLVTLPVPPSTNNLYRTGRNEQGKFARFKTRAYKDWIRAAGLLLNRARLAPIPARLPIALRIEVNVSRQRDITNVVKPLEDLLTRGRVIEDDRWVDYQTTLRVDDLERDTLRFEVAALLAVPERSSD